MNLSMKLLVTGCCLLTACAGTPSPRSPPLRQAAEQAHRAALSAAAAGRWQSAEQGWREALMAYQAMDDWAGQGWARLGLAQAHARLGRDDLALGVIDGMAAQALFPQPLRARAAYQQALLLASGGRILARSRLAQARDLCARPCALSVQFDNLGARLALLDGERGLAQKLARQALHGADELPAERAHACRLLAELALLERAFAEALVYLEAALVDDRKLAEPQWLLDDYRLLEKLAAAMGDEKRLEEARLRQSSLCAGASLPGCDVAGAGKP